MFPGITANVVNAMLSIKNSKAVILETYGSGNSTTEKWFIDALKKAIDNGIIIRMLLNVMPVLLYKVSMQPVHYSKK